MNLPHTKERFTMFEQRKKGESTLLTFFVDKRTHKQCHSSNFQVLKINSTYVIYYKGRY